MSHSDFCVRHRFFFSNRRKPGSMADTTRRRPLRALAASLSMAALLAACGGSDGGLGDAGASARAVALAADNWVECAFEGGQCDVPGTRTVRYGADGTYAFKTVTGSIACNNETWGDPLFGVFKSCAYSADAPPPVATTLTGLRYAASAENFANPERGLPLVYDVAWPAQVTWGFCGQNSGGIDNFRDYNYTAWNDPLDQAVLRASRDRGTTLVLHRYHIADFRNRPLSDQYLQHLQRDFDAVRNAGLKMVPRFAYNYPMGGPDAPLDRVLGHFDQLKPLLARNQDVIAFVEMGMVGCWGEMHTSANNLMDVSRGYRRLNDATKAVIDKAFASVPAERMVAVRYPEYKFQFFNGLQDDPVRENEPIAPISAAEGFDQSIRSRWAQYDDCIVCGEWNAGTYLNPASRASGGAMKVRNFLQQDNRYVVQGGELSAGCCDKPDPPVDEDGDGSTDYTACSRVMPLFRQMRFSTFNHNYPGDAPNVERWKREGCFDAITTQLGYRFELVEAALPASLPRGAALQGSITVRNVGWAAPYNPRGLELVLRNSASGQLFRISLLRERQTRNDPRRWLPDEGNISIDLAVASLPPDLPSGGYELLLNLPDPMPSLYGRTDYAMRLANQDTWEVGSGFNRLGHTLQVQ
jgi:Domain of unknown function (DUF4832)/Domain of unknown function (DUF4874)